MPLARGRVKYVIVAIDYFIKWVEVEPLTDIIEAKMSGFIWKNIIYPFGIPYALMIDNEKQFDNKIYQKMCLELRIRYCFSLPVYL